MNDVARLFLETYARGGEVDGGWKFGRALQQAQLDYSEDSLQRIDLLLKAIRERAKPQYDAFIADPQGRNFISLLGFYLMTVLSRRTGAEIEWHDAGSAREAVSEWAHIDETPFTRVVALAPDQGLLFLPLVWLHDRLFSLGLGQVETASDYLRSVAQELEYDLPMAWWNAARLLGVAASTLMSRVAEGRPALPQLAWQHPRGPRVQSLTLDYDGPDAVAIGEAALADNREQALWRTFAHDTWIHSSGKRVPAISATVQAYGQAPLRLRMAFRYERAAGDEPFAILDPSVWEFNVPEETFLRLNAAVQRGARSVRWPSGKSWSDFFAGRRDVPSLLPAAIEVPPSYRSGEQVRKGDAVLTDGGLYPARVVQLEPGADGHMACVFQDVRGSRRTATATQLRDDMAFVSRSPADHLAACIAWLQSHAQKPARPGADPKALGGSAHACFALGNLMWQGLAVPRDRAGALPLWQGAANAGYPPAELALAVALLEGDGVKADVAKGLALLHSAVAKGHPPALARLGQELETGLRLPGDAAQAVSVLTRAVEAGSAHGTYRLAWMHRIGKGVAHDMARCVALLSQAAAGDFAQAQYELAMHCSTGDGVPQDDARAAYWLERAVQGDHGEAMIMLAGKYERGRGVPQDLERAVALYKRAADKRIPAAFYHLGVLTADGRGLDRDLREAMRLMTLAARDGVHDAREQLEDLSLAMTRESRR
ncbi:MAG: tetratricopeptide repeat protein [Burkholderiaceae bacterium]